MIRPLRSEDISKLKEIHDKYYSDKFPFPDFTDLNYTGAVVITDDSGEIISVAGVRTLLEVVAITDKSFSPELKIQALENILAFSAFTAKELNHKEIHAFIQDDPKWVKHLENFGFSRIAGTGLVLKF